MTTRARNLLIVIALLALSGFAVLLITPILSNARIEWPAVADYNLLVADCVQLSQEQPSGLVNSVVWSESIRTLSPRFVSVQTGLVMIVLSTGGIDAGWGFLVYTDPDLNLKDLHRPHLQPTTHRQVYRSSHIE